MKPASNQLSNISSKFEVLLDVGAISDSFYYLDGDNLGVQVGDIVTVKLRGRLLNGLVISKENFSKINKDEEKKAGRRSINLSLIHI